jgi:coiled-coil domain-containing protein 151
MARPPGADDEYQDLQKRFQILESDRKNLFEHTQLEVKKNKEALAKLKKENKELRSSLSSLMSDQGRSTGKDSEISKLELQVADLRRKHDDVRHQCQFRQKELDTMQDKLKDLEKEMDKLKDDDTPLTRNIRTLENRLDKAMIKYNEAQSIRKTYEQIVKRLKEERIGFDNQLAAIERTLKAKEKDLEELVLMSHDAQHAKEVAKAELLKLEHQLMEEKKQREKELADRRALVQQKVEMNQRMEKRDKMRREMAMVEGGEQGGGDGDAGMKKNMFSTAFHSALNEHVMEEEQKKITTYEEAFRKIKDATGVSDVNEVIQKFLTQDETHNNLVVMTKEAQARIDALNEEKTQAKAKVEEIKYSGTGSLGSRRIVDEFESHLSEASSKCERNKQKYERIAKILINVKSGVEHLADKLEPITVEQEAVVMTDSTVVEVLAQCEAKLMRLMDSLEGDQATMEDAAGQEKMMTSQEIEMPAYNIRIQIPHDAEDDSGDDDMEEDDQEDVPDRDQVKKYSSLMLEKANKKQKRQRKRKSEGGGTKGSKSGGKRPDIA